MSFAILALLVVVAVGAAVGQIWDAPFFGAVLAMVATFGALLWLGRPPKD